MLDALSSPSAYQSFIYALPERYPAIQHSTLVYVASGSLFGYVEGILFFQSDITLCILEQLNFELEIIASYGYEVSQSLIDPFSNAFPDMNRYCQASYPNKRKFYWYDSFPHPHIPELASTHPHHKHVPPNIKHNRIPAPNLSFNRPNLPFLIEEIETIVKPTSGS